MQESESFSRQLFMDQYNKALEEIKLIYQDQKKFDAKHRPSFFAGYISILQRLIENKCCTNTEKTKLEIFISLLKILQRFHVVYLKLKFWAECREKNPTKRVNIDGVITTFDMIDKEFVEVEKTLSSFQDRFPNFPLGITPQRFETFRESIEHGRKLYNIEKISTSHNTNEVSNFLSGVTNFFNGLLTETKKEGTIVKKSTVPKSKIKKEKPKLKKTELHKKILNLIERNLQKEVHIENYEQSYEDLYKKLQSSKTILYKSITLIKLQKKLLLVIKHFLSNGSKDKALALQHLYNEKRELIEGCSHISSQEVHDMDLCLEEFYLICQNLKNVNKYIDSLIGETDELVFNYFESFTNFYIHTFPKLDSYIQFFIQILEKLNSYDGNTTLLKASLYFYLWECKFLKKEANEKFIIFFKEAKFKKVFNHILEMNQQEFGSGLKVLELLDDHLCKHLNDLDEKDQKEISEIGDEFFNNIKAYEEYFKKQITDALEKLQSSEPKNMKRQVDNILSILASYKAIVRFASKKPKPSGYEEVDLSYKSVEGSIIKTFNDLTHSTIKDIFKITKEKEEEINSTLRISELKEDNIVSQEIPSILNEFCKQFKNDIQEISANFLGDQHNPDTVKSMASWCHDITPSSNISIQLHLDESSSEENNNGSAISTENTLPVNNNEPVLDISISINSISDKKEFHAPKFKIELYSEKTIEEQYVEYKDLLMKFDEIKNNEQETSSQSTEISDCLKEAHIIMDNYYKDKTEAQETLLNNLPSIIGSFSINLETATSIDDQLKEYNASCDQHINECSQYLNEHLKLLKDIKDLTYIQKLGTASSEKLCQEMVANITKNSMDEKKHAHTTCNDYKLQIQAFEEKINRIVITQDNLDDSMMALDEIHIDFLKKFPKKDVEALKKLVRDKFERVFELVKERSLEDQLDWILIKLNAIPNANLNPIIKNSLIPIVEKVRLIGKADDTFFPMLKQIFKSHQRIEIDESDMRTIHQGNNIIPFPEMPEFVIQLNFDESLEDQERKHRENHLNKFPIDQEKFLNTLTEELDKKGIKQTSRDHLLKRARDITDLQIKCLGILTQNTVDEYQRRKELMNEKISAVNISQEQSLIGAIQKLKQIQTDLKNFIKVDIENFKKNIQKKLNDFFENKSQLLQSQERFNWILDQCASIQGQQPIQLLVKSIREASIQDSDAEVLFPILLAIYKQSQCSDLVENNEADITLALKALHEQSKKYDSIITVLSVIAMIVLLLIITSSILAIAAPGLGLMVVFGAIAKFVTDVTLAAGAFLLGASGAAAATAGIGGTIAAASIGSAGVIGLVSLTAVKAVSFYKQKRHETEMEGIYNQANTLLQR